MASCSLPATRPTARTKRHCLITIQVTSGQTYAAWDGYLSLSLSLFLRSPLPMPGPSLRTSDIIIQVNEMLREKHPRPSHAAPCPALGISGTICVDRGQTSDKNSPAHIPGPCPPPPDWGEAGEGTGRQADNDALSPCQMGRPPVSSINVTCLYK